VSPYLNFKGTFAISGGHNKYIVTTVLFFFTRYTMSYRQYTMSYRLVLDILRCHSDRHLLKGTTENESMISNLFLTC